MNIQLDLFSTPPEPPKRPPGETPEIVANTSPAPPAAVVTTDARHHKIAEEIRARLDIATDGSLAGVVVRWPNGDPIGVSVRGRFYHWRGRDWKIILEKEKGHALR